MLYLPRPPENSSGPWPRASNTGKAGRSESARETVAVNVLFQNKLLIHSVITLPFALFLLLLKITNTESCFSSGSTVLELNAPDGVEGVVQKANTNLGSINTFSIFSLHLFSYGHLKTVILKAFKLLIILMFFLGGGFKVDCGKLGLLW